MTLAYIEDFLLDILLVNSSEIHMKKSFRLEKVLGSESISRVLSWTAIHLRRASPLACSNLPESSAGTH